MEVITCMYGSSWLSWNNYVTVVLFDAEMLDCLEVKTHLVYKTLVRFRLPNTKFPIQAYIQTIYVRNMKYKQYLNKQTTLSH